jgi:hypothetical protein
VFEGGEFAVTTHAGPFVTLPAAYAAIFPRVTHLPKHQLIGLPAVEIYQTARVNARLQLNVTDICLPVVGFRFRTFFSTRIIGLATSARVALLYSTESISVSVLDRRKLCFS